MVLIAVALVALRGLPANGDARCTDGWYSESSGSGTCSNHGGVDYWITPGSGSGAASLTTPLYVPRAASVEEDDDTNYLPWLVGVGLVALIFWPSGSKPKPQGKSGGR